MTKNLLHNFLNETGQVVQWPAKFSAQELVLDYLTDKFALKTTYTEREANDILRQWHTFEDWAILRRSLVESGRLQRNRDGTEYRRVR